MKHTKPLTKPQKAEMDDKFLLRKPKPKAMG